jgi:hypothetical protein
VKTLRYLVLGVSTLAIDTSAFAATLTSIQGLVRVNVGNGFHRVTGSREVYPGASVMAALESSAEIVYPDGCRIPVTAGAVVGVAPVSPCTQGPGYVDYLGYGLALGAGIGIGCAIWCNRHGHTVVVTATAPASP